MKITSHEGFQLIMSFLILPLIFLSGAFYPVKTMPGWMKLLALVNPLTYGVDGMRYWLVGVSEINPIVDLVVLTGLAGVLAIAASVLFERATLD